MKKFKIWSFFLLLLCFTLNCQNKKTNSIESEEKNKPEKQLTAKQKSFSYFMRLAETSDMLYLNDSSSFYLMDQSPSKVFDQYQDIYEDYKEIAAVDSDPEPGTFVLSGPKNSYFVHWFLIDRTLYLADIKFFTNPKTVFRFNEQYRLMENLTKVKFNKDISRKYRIHNSIVSEQGLMPAIWVSNIFIIKKVRKYEENYESWIEIPCIELVFQKGKLVSMKIREDMY